MRLRIPLLDFKMLPTLIDSRSAFVLPGIGRMYYISPDSCVDCSNCVPMYSTLIGRPLKKVTDHVRS